MLALLGAALLITRALPLLGVIGGPFGLVLIGAVLLAAAVQAAALWFLIWTALAWVAARSALPTSIARRLRGAVESSGPATAKALLQRATAASAIAGTSLVGSVGIANAIEAPDDLLWTTDVESSASAPVEDLLWFPAEVIPGTGNEPGAGGEEPDTTEVATAPTDSIPDPSDVESAAEGNRGSAGTTAIEGSSGGGQEMLVEAPSSDRTNRPTSTDPGPNQGQAGRGTTALGLANGAWPRHGGLMEQLSGRTGVRHGAPISRAFDANPRGDHSRQATMLKRAVKQAPRSSAEWSGGSGEKDGATPSPEPQIDNESLVKTHLVVPGDCLWDIAKSRLPAEANSSQIDAAWRAIYELNQELIGSDSNQIEPGQMLALPEEVLH